MKPCGCLDDAKECATARSFVGTLCPCKCHAEPAIAPLTDAELDKLVKNLEEMETEDVQGYAAVVLGQQMGLAAEAITDLRAEITALRGGK